MSTTTITITNAITYTHHKPIRIGSVQDSSLVDEDTPSTEAAGVPALCA